MNTVKNRFIWDDEDIEQIFGFSSVEKANPYHDAKGRFTSAGRAVAAGRTTRRRKADPRRRQTLSEASSSPRALVRAGVMSEQHLGRSWRTLERLVKGKYARFYGFAYRADEQRMVARAFRLAREKDYDDAFSELPDEMQGRFLKIVVQQNLGRALEAKFTRQQLSSAVKELERLGMMSKYADTPQMSERIARHFVGAWASSSESSESLVMSEMARKLFGVQGTYDTRSEEQVISRIKLSGTTARVLQELARAMHRDTQKYLGAAGITEAVVFRGTGINAGRMNVRQMLSDMSTGRKSQILVTQRPLASWSSSVDIAYSFAEMGVSDTGGRRFIVVEATVPASRVFCTPLTGFGCFREKEVVLLAPNSKSFKAQVISELSAA